MKRSDGASAKGATVQSLMSFLRKEGGEALAGRVAARLDADRRNQIESARATDEVPFDWMAELLVAADEELGKSDPDWSERAGEFAIASAGQEHYGGIIRKATPLEFLMQPVQLFRLYYQPGGMEVVEHADGRAVLRLVGFDRQTPLFCARQTGGLRAALKGAGGKNPKVKHVRCSAHGDAFCEWELKWDSA